MCVRRQIEPSRGQSSLVVRDHVPAWLDDLIRALDPAAIAAGEDGNRVSEASGLQRAGIPGYDLTSVLREYGLLRQVLIHVLEEDGPLPAIDHAIIDQAVDTLISLAAGEFTEYRRAIVQSALAEVERSNLDLEHVAVSAAHDLKSPLTAIVAYLDLMVADVAKNGRGVTRYLAPTRIQVKRMAILIERLMAYATLRGSGVTATFPTEL